MRIVRAVSCAIFFCAVMLSRTVPLSAAINCNTINCSHILAQVYGKAGKLCLGSAQNCDDFIETCDQVCDAQNGVDVAASDCQEDEESGSGHCYCKGWSSCGQQTCTSCSESSSCCSDCQFTWMPEGYCNTGSPILINLAGGLSDHLTSPENGVLFDIRASGRLDRVAWTQAGRDVAFLALDRNGNGAIDSGAELFGTFTPKRDGAPALNGFDALEDLDGGPGVSDGRINRSDELFARLRLWVDADHNGQSDASELLTLDQGRVDTIFTAYRERRFRDRHGNWYRYEGTVLLRRGAHQTVSRRVFDVFLKIALPEQMTSTAPSSSRRRQG